MAEPLNPTPQQQSEILMQALPHMLRYDEAIVVVKYGGHAMGDEDKARDFAKDMVLLEQSGINPVVVHGGGPQINQLIEKLGLKSTFVRGMRVTDAPTMDAVEMVLQKISKEIVALISRQGGRAVAGLFQRGQHEFGHVGLSGRGRTVTPGPPVALPPGESLFREPVEYRHHGGVS